MSSPIITRPRWGFFVALSAVAVLTRLAPQLLVRLVSAEYDMSAVNYMWGFTPMLAFGLFAGAFLKNPWHSIGLILGTLLVGDLGILALSRDWMQIDPGTYLAYPLCVLLGRPLSQNRSWGRVQTGSLLACTVFYLVTNVLVWAAWRHLYAIELYPPTLLGLKNCLLAGIPFAKYFISTPIFSGLLFSPLGVAQVTEVAVSRKSELATA